MPEQPILIETVATVSGIRPPNPAALVALGDLATVFADLERLRGTLRFEDEPSSFEQALLDCREPAR